MSHLILPNFYKPGLIHTECERLTGLPAVHICLLLKINGASWRGESNDTNHRLLSSWNLLFMDTVSAEKLKPLVSSLPKPLKRVTERKLMGNMTQKLLSLSRFVHIVWKQICEDTENCSFGFVLNKGSNQWTNHIFKYFHILENLPTSVSKKSWHHSVGTWVPSDRING